MSGRLERDETLEGSALASVLSKVPVDDTGLARAFAAAEANGRGRSTTAPQRT
jgi:hypothetical protein